MKPWMRLVLALGILVALLPATGHSLQGPAAEAEALAARVSGRALRQGDVGEPVAALQRLLRALGFDPGPVDGIFGPLTEGAVLRAQAALKLGQDGHAGRLTVAGLREMAGGSGQASAPAEAPVSTSPSTGADPGPDAPAGAPEPPAAEPAPGKAVPEPRESQEGTLHLHWASAPDPGHVISDAELGPVLTPSGLMLHRAQPAMSGAMSRGMAFEPGPRDFALTFNGAPDPELLPGLLKALAQYEVKATFFISGEAAEDRPDLVALISQAGHEIGNAGYTGINMTRLTDVMARAQLSRAQKALTAASGKAPAFFRPPLGFFSKSLLQSAASVHLQTALWDNVGARDEPGLEPGELTEKLVGVIRPGAVMMLHQDRRETVQAMDGLLDELTGRGYRSVTLTRLEDERAARL